MGRLRVVGLVGVVGLVAGGCGVADATIEGDALPEPDTGVTIVDTDVPLQSDDGTVSNTQGLTVAQVNGRDDLWPSAQRQNLSYCIDVSSFGADASSVEAAMRTATADWERSANVHFVHRTTEDGQCSRSNARVVFDVRRVTRRPYLARSFFPSSTRTVREVLVDATSLPPPPPLTLAGVLRHELGHVLGLRHEHTRSPSNPCYEDSQWRAVTAYDVRSVMHYPQCAGVMGRDLTLTALDRQGIATLYR